MKWLYFLGNPHTHTHLVFYSYITPSYYYHEDAIPHEIAAYSQKQLHYCKCMAESCAMAWLPILQSEDIKPEWDHRYDQLISGKKSGSTVPFYVENETNEDENYEGESGEKHASEGRYDAFEIDD